MCVVVVVVHVGVWKKTQKVSVFGGRVVGGDTAPADAQINFLFVYREVKKEKNWLPLQTWSKGQLGMTGSLRWKIMMILNI